MEKRQIRNKSLNSVDVMQKIEYFAERTSSGSAQEDA